MRKLLVFTLLLMLGALHIQAVPTAQAQASGTITQVLRSSSTHNLFIEIAEEVGLADDLDVRSRTYTVFVPPNDAMLGLLNNLAASQAQAFSDRNLLKQIIQYHILGGEVTAAEITLYTQPQSVFTFSNQALIVGYDAGARRVVLNNGDSVVVNPNVTVDNGILHFINNTLVPPGVDLSVPAPVGGTASQPGFAIPPNSIPDIANRNGLTAFVRAITAAGLLETLSTTPNLTVFAPRNGAFDTLQNATGITPEAAPVGVLTFHVSPHQFSAFDLANIATGSAGATLNGQPIGGGGSLAGTIKTLNGTPLRLQLGSGSIVLNNGNALVTGPDKAASNGVIHIIDNVLLP